MDKDNEPQYIKLLGMARMTSKIIPPPDINEIYPKFLLVPEESLDIPAGDVNIMPGPSLNFQNPESVLLFTFYIYIFFTF